MKLNYEYGKYKFSQYDGTKESAESLGLKIVEQPFSDVWYARGTYNYNYNQGVVNKWDMVPDNLEAYNLIRTNSITPGELNIIMSILKANKNEVVSFVKGTMKLSGDEEQYYQISVEGKHPVGIYSARNLINKGFEDALDYIYQTNKNDELEGYTIQVTEAKIDKPIVASAKSYSLDLGSYYKRSCGKKIFFISDYFH